MVKLSALAFTLISTSFFLLIFKISNSFSFAFSGNESFEIRLEDKNISPSDGSLVSLSEKGYALSSIPYDPNFAGVINRNPDIVYKQEINLPENKLPLSFRGSVYTLVSNKNGNLKIGDLVTTTENQGVGQKATEDGFVIGRSLEDVVFTNSNPSLVLVMLDPHIHSKVLVFDSKVGSSGIKRIMAVFYNFLKTGGGAAENEPSKVFRYILAIIVVVMSLGAGFLLFGRVAIKGLDAIGRNPLAGKLITTGILINSVLTVIVALSGLVLAYLIISY